MKSRQARPAGARTDSAGCPSARIATVTCYEARLVVHSGAGGLTTYPNKRYRVDETLNKERIAGDARETGC